MSYSAKIVADSVTSVGWRLTSMEVCLPRIVLAELNTHRKFSRNSASSRAIPVEKMLRMVQENPYVPEEFGSNQRGMQAGAPLEGLHAERSRDAWLRARDAAVAHAEELRSQGVHKQLTNRLLEPFLWHTVLISSTDWQNFFNLRDNPSAHPAIREAASLMRSAYHGSEPKRLQIGEWHTPYVGPDDMPLPLAGHLKVSAARCARLSYLTHDGRRDTAEDLELFDRLLGSGHMSPFEHVARPMYPHELRCALQCTIILEDGSSLILRAEDAWPKVGGTWLGVEILSRHVEAPCGNFDGWVQYRKTVPFEWDKLGAR